MVDREGRDLQKPKSWGELYEVCFPRLLSYALHLNDGSHSSAEDLANGAFCKILESAKPFGDVDNPCAYVKRALHNLWCDDCRKANKLKTVSLTKEEGDTSLDELPIVEPTVERFLENEDRRKSLDFAVRDFKPVDKRILHLHLEGLDCDEIALAVNRDIYFVRFALNAVRAKVKYRLKT